MVIVPAIVVLSGCSSESLTGASNGRQTESSAADSSASSSTTSELAPSQTAPATEGSATEASATETSGGKPDDDEDGDDAADDDGGDAETATVTPAVVLRQSGMDQAFLDSLQTMDGINWVATVDLGQVHLTSSATSLGRTVDSPPPGFVIQLEAIAHSDIDSVRHYAPDLAPSLAELSEREVILGTSSAGLRRLDVGSTINFANEGGPDGDETVFTVASILPDDVVGTAEVVFGDAEALAAAGAGRSVRQVAFVDYSGTGTELEQKLLADNGDRGIRVFGGRGDGQRDRARTTLPTIEVKKIFGEFAFRSQGPSAIEIDPRWIEANLVTAELPLLGQARCHRVFAEILTEVLQGLIDDGLADVIDPSAFQGCWNARRIAGSARISKHSWGMAADINFGNPLDGGPGSPVHPELLARMLEADVISGHLWTATPDPGHFEYRGP